MYAVSPYKYKEVQLDLTPEIKVFHMLLERCNTKMERNLTNSIL